MAFELRLSFSGLTALVPHKEADDLNPANEWLVVMPALQRGTSFKKGTQEFTIASHQAVMIANAQAVHAGETTKPVRLRLRNPTSSPNDEQSDLLFEINQEVLEIGSGPVGLQVQLGVAANQELPDVNAPAERHDIKWVPPITKCLDTGVRLDRNLFDPATLRPNDGRLTGIVRLDRGILQTSDVHTGLHNQSVLYEFRKGSSTGPVRFRQALADGFHLSVRVQEATATLNLTDHLGNETHLVVGIYPGCPLNENHEPLVEVKVFNEELEDILGLGIASKPLSPTQGDTDFVIFYTLSPEWATLDAKDLVIPYLASGGGGGSNKPCEPPQYPGLGG